MEIAFFSNPMSSHPDRPTVETQAAIDLVADYYRQQIAFENDREHLVEILEWVRLSFSCYFLAIELSEETRQEILRIQPLSQTAAQLPECQAAAIALEVAAQRQVEENLQPPTSDSTVQAETVLPEFEQLRHGDPIEILPKGNEPRRYGSFFRYTDPRIGHQKRMAWVAPDDSDLVLEFSPNQLRFASESEPYTRRYEHLRVWRDSGFELHLYDTGCTDRHGKSILAYEFLDWGFVQGTALIFRGEDFICSPLDAVDSDATVAALLSFLSLQPGDTDQEYFSKYSPLQLAWRDERAESLAGLVFDLE